MKKKISLMLALALALTMFASVIVSHAADPIVYDITTEGIAGKGDEIKDGAKFFGKEKRFQYDYVNGVSKLIYSGVDGANNPYITNPSTNIDASVYKFVKIAYWTKVSAAKAMNFFFDNGNGIVGGNNKEAPITADGSWQYAVIDMSDVATWTGTIKQIRYDFLYGGEFEAGDYVYCGYIALFDSVDAANNYNITLPDMAAFEGGKTEEPGFTLDNTKYELTDDFSIKLTFQNAPAVDTWFGIYPASVTEPITSANSLGVWCYTNTTHDIPAEWIKDGTITLTKSICDNFSALTKGEYKIIMFKGGSEADTYTILETKTFSFVDKGTDIPTPPTPTGDENIIIAAAIFAVIVAATIVCYRKQKQV